MTNFYYYPNNLFNNIQTINQLNCGSHVKMPAYHSKLGNVSQETLGNMAYLTFRTAFRGPVRVLDERHIVDELDIVDESLLYFKPNVFFKSYEIQSDADRVVIYLILYISECIKKILKCTNMEQARTELHALAMSRFPIPGEPNFPLNSMFQRPSKPEHIELMSSYLLQLRQECSHRLLSRLYPDPRQEKPSKWWTCFAKRKFMDKSLSK